MHLTRCPQCQHVHVAIPEIDDSAGTEYWLNHILGFCRERGIEHGIDGTVSEKHAAVILDRSPLTLRNRRLGGCPIPFTSHGGRIRYQVIEIARYLAASRPVGEPY